MIHTALVIILIIVGAIVGFILVDKAGQPDPLPWIIKLVILIVALLAIARVLGYA